MVLNVGAEGFSFVLAYIEPENMLLLFFFMVSPTFGSLSCLEVFSHF